MPTEQQILSEEAVAKVEFAYKSAYEDEHYIEVSRSVPALCQTVRALQECLRDLSDDGCYDYCWHRWGKERDDDQYHSDACKTARRLIENLDHQGD